MGDWIVRLIEQSGYLGIGFLMFLETLFPPIPSEVIMPVAGVAVGKGQMSAAGVIAAGTAGAMLGNVIWYLAARALGHDRLRPLINKHGKWLTMNWTDVERAHRWFDSHGIAFVLTGRLVPTVRSLVSIPAGLARHALPQLHDRLGHRHRDLDELLTILGMKLQKEFSTIERVGPISTAVLVILVLVYVVRLARHKGDA